MSKLSKLIKTPNLYFKDALKIHLNKKLVKAPVKIKETKQNTSIIEVEKYKLDINELKVNLIILDSLAEKPEIKKNIVKFQNRSIEKYCDFASVSYISDEIKLLHKDVTTFKNYKEFYNKKVLANANKNEIYIFVNLNFFFLKKLKIENLVKNNGKLITYIKKNKCKTLNYDEQINKIISGASYNFTPMENFCICNTMSLVFFNKNSVKENLDSKFLFQFLPITGTILQQNYIQDSPIQYARLDHGYIEKFVWIQSVHGSNRCPLAITFDKKVSNKEIYFEFLNNLFPHTGKYENLISINKQDT